MKTHITLKNLMFLALIASILLVGCVPASPVPPSAQPPSATLPPEPVLTSTPTPLPPMATSNASPVPPSATRTAQPSPLPATATPTLPKPTATRAPSSTPEPTFAFFNKTVRAPSGGARLLNFEEGAVWMALPPDTLYRIDLKTGKTLSQQKFGCVVCFGPCDFFSAYRDGQYFWSLQYGGIGEQNCAADNPWTSIGFMLRQIKIGSTASEYIDITSILANADAPNLSVIAVVDGKIWLAVSQTIYVIDAGKSKTDKPAIIKTIFPGIYVESLLFANNMMWAAGDALLSIDPKTYQVGSIYPLEAQLLAYDGQTIWGANKYSFTLQSVNLSTRQLSDPIPLPELPYALGCDGKNIWVAFENTRDLAVIPVK